MIGGTLGAAGRGRAPALGLLSAVLAVVLATPPALAWPVFSEAEIATGLRCFPDLSEPDLWWYLPRRLQLATGDGGPSFSFHRFRYVGSSATGDRSLFWARGVLSFGVRLETLPGEVADARRELERRFGRPGGSIRLEPLAVERIVSRLLYAEAGAGGAAGAIDGGEWDGPWSARSFSVGLEPASAALLWDALHADRLVLSLGYGFEARGLVTRPEPTADRGTAPPRVVELAGDALPIRVSPADCPGCYPSTDLDAEIPAQYPFLDVYCTDFVAPGTERDLGMIRVDVRATAIAGDLLTEEVRFLPDGGTRMPVHFRFAVRLDRGYEFRTSRIFADGRLESDPWRSRPSWAAVLDVSRYRVAGATLDARALY